MMHGNMNCAITIITTVKNNAAHQVVKNIDLDIHVQIQKKIHNNVLVDACHVQRQLTVLSIRLPVVIHDAINDLLSISLSKSLSISLSI